MSEEKPPERGALPRVKGRLPFDTGQLRGASLKQSALIVYGLIFAALVGTALYMALVQRMDLMSPWVLAPAIGALWFALRLFMIWGSRS